MNMKKRKMFYKLIVEELEKTLQDADEYKKEMADLGDLTEIGMSDRATIDDIKISLMQMETHRSAKIRQIYEALEKLDQDKYGNCELCDKPISEGRLEFLPFAKYCIECQSGVEQDQRFTSPAKRPYKPKSKVTDDEWEQWVEGEDR